MSEQEKKMAEVIREGFQQLSEFDKGYFLAKIEEAAEKTQRKERTNESGKE